MSHRVWDEEQIMWMRESLTYCPETGKFWWKKRFSNRIRRDLSAGSQHPSGYITMTKVFNGSIKTFKAHRIAWFLHYGYQPNMLDHINQDKADNRIINLRECEMRKNLGNQKPKNILGVKGVVKLPNGKYQARCLQVYLGVFDDLIDAARSYDAEAIKVFGEFAYTNKEHGVY